MERIQKRGFTLIELLIAMAVVAILSAIAYPSYIDQVRKTRRADAQGALVELQNFMERFFTVNNCYQDKGADNSCSATVDNANPTLPFTTAPRTGTAYYNLSLSAIGPSNYTLQATPTGPQASDPCGKLTLSDTGTKGADKADCW